MKYSYWDLVGKGGKTCQGRGEFVKYILAHAGVEYEFISASAFDENGVDHGLANWLLQEKPKLQASVDPLINLPYLVTDEGTYISESNAILLYLARKLNYFGENATEEVRVTSCLMRLYDFRDSIRKNIMLQPKGDAKAFYAAAGVYQFLNGFEALFKLNSTKYLCSNTITVADFVLFQMLDKVHRWKPSVLDKLPLTKQWFEVTMLGDAKVKAHYDKVKEHPWTCDYRVWVENMPETFKKTPMYAKIREQTFGGPEQYWGCETAGEPAEY